MSERDEALKSVRPDRSERKRIPLHKRDIISFNKEDGYKYRLFNDKDGRLQKAQEAGWDFVDSSQGLGDTAAGKPTKIGKRVSMPVGDGKMGYLMRIPQEWYDEDQKEKQKMVDATEAATKPNAARNEYGEGLTTDKL